MTIYITTVRNARDRLANAHASASGMAKALREDLNKASAFRDPNLSDQGVANKRQELAREFREAGRVDFEKVAEHITWARKTLAEYARENVKLPDDAVTLIRAQQKWSQVERRLDSGQDLHTIMRDADEDTARAIAEFGPSWASAQFTRPEGLDGAVRAWLGETRTDAVDSIHKAVYRRLAEVATDPNARELFAAETAADAQAAIAQPWLDASRSLVEHGGANMLGAAIASAIAAKEAAPAAVPAESAPTAA